MPPTPRFGLFNTEAHVLHSEFTGQDYQIGVWFPFSYFSSDRAYPVLYVPDGEYVYPAVAGLMPMLMGAGDVPEMLVVGIAYEGISTWAEFSDQRHRDLLPQEFLDADQPSRHPEYIRFFNEELFPFIGSHYRADPAERAVFGFSNGGVFALNMLFTQPGMFRRYVAASCTWPGPGDYFADCARGYTCRVDPPAADVFLAAGGCEDDQLPGFHTLAGLLADGPCPKLRFTSQVFEGEGHSAGMIAKTTLMGIKAVFK